MQKRIKRVSREAKENQESIKRSKREAKENQESIKRSKRESIVRLGFLLNKNNLYRFHRNYFIHLLQSQ